MSPDRVRAVAHSSPPATACPTSTKPSPGRTAPITAVTPFESADSRLILLHSTSAALLIAETMREVADILITNALASLAATGGAVAVLNDGATALHFVHTVGAPPRACLESDRDAFSDSHLLTIAQRCREATYIGSVREFQEFHPMLSTRLQADAAAIIPLVAQERERLGVFVLTFACPRAFPVEMRAQLSALAWLGAHAIRRIRQAELASLANGDLIRSIQQAQPAMLIADAATDSIVLANVAAERLWRRKLVTPMPLADYCALKAMHWGGRYYVPSERPLVRALRKCETVLGEQMCIERGDGSWSIIRASAFPVVDEQARVVSGVATLEQVGEF